MPYRRTENVVRRLAEREQTILDAARSIAGEKGMGAVQIAAVAHRADIAAGTVYRYFPVENDLVAEVIAAAAVANSPRCTLPADAAPGPLSALAACLATFAARALHEARLAWAMMAEPVDADIDALRLEFPSRARDRTGNAYQHGDRRRPFAGSGCARRRAGRLGALLEGLLGPLAPPAATMPACREAVQTMTLFALRALGVVDARARGLVAQCALP